MKDLIKSMLNKVLPAFFLRTMKYKVLEKVGQQHWGEQDASWYDQSFESHDHWKNHYSKSGYYFLWAVITDRILSSDQKSILEIACGPGQLAALLQDKGITQFVGIDFSVKRLEQAKKLCPQFSFFQADVFECDYLESLSYDLVVCTEFLEHVEKDLTVLKRIKTGTRFLGTVPNFPYVSHVRHFKNKAEVYSRYSSFFQKLQVDTFLADEKGATFFLMDGIV